MAELGIGFIAYCPLYRALPLGTINLNSRFEATDRKATLPQFTPGALKVNMAFADLVGHWTNKLGITRVQYARLGSFTRRQHRADPFTEKQIDKS